MASVVTDMESHSKMKAEMMHVIKEAVDSNSGKDYNVVSGIIKHKLDSSYGPTWHVIVGDEFKASVSHESKTYLFMPLGKTNVLAYRCS